MVWPYDNFRIINTAVLMWACSCLRFLPVKRQVLSCFFTGVWSKVRLWVSEKVKIWAQSRRESRVFSTLSASQRRSSWSKSEEATDMMPVWTDGAKILKALVISMLLLEHREGRVLFLHNSGIQSLWALITNTVSLFDIVIPLFDWCIEL